MARILVRADLILSVSHFNTEQLLGGLFAAEVRVAYVPNAADDLFFEPALCTSASESATIWGCRPDVPYLLSVANFQPRKNLLRLIKAAARLPEVASGELAVVLIGTGRPEASQFAA